ncbi:hypothetical protein PEDI_19430 [Persicobacter diffluens]|uniref:Uncharacterized protein n=1 Tax=Persicobacter diffluens TaxID=981 RepID=A0AAN5ALF4_9BACT|nr:hypothetical protein PEDI_19430 [Persicobacter diffluens]
MHLKSFTVAVRLFLEKNYCFEASGWRSVKETMVSV